jgi:hypothetical protein
MKIGFLGKIQNKIIKIFIITPQTLWGFFIVRIYKKL